MRRDTHIGSLSTTFQIRIRTIGGFNQRQGKALPPQIFLTLKFVVWAKLQNDDVLLQSVYSQENYRNCCHLMSDFKVKKASNSISAGAPPQTPLGDLAALPQTSSWPHPALGRPGLKTTCLPKYVSLNLPMIRTLINVSSPWRLTHINIHVGTAPLRWKATKALRSRVYYAYIANLVFNVVGGSPPLRSRSPDSPDWF